MLSVALSRNTYTPCARLDAEALRLEAEPIVAAVGPPICDHCVDEIVAPPLPVALPVSVTEFVGSVIVCALPAPTVGGVKVGGGPAELTVTVTEEVAV